MASCQGNSRFKSKMPLVLACSRGQRKVRQHVFDLRRSRG
ncbi:hypothetical protein COLO4_27477 [Corchorus olitorius]|uniref:Uncharacterized protein n=1 Tax=Corchorus olitorius TaxID=93759 RepID=A0A1R3HQR2_9ROSI|nr:hypothetical protein COLO4_27477 [Corchorus olitorius]